MFSSLIVTNPLVTGSLKQSFTDPEKVTSEGDEFTVITPRSAVVVKGPMLWECSSVRHLLYIFSCRVLLAGNLPVTTPSAFVIPLPDMVPAVPPPGGIEIVTSAPSILLPFSFLMIPENSITGKGASQFQKEKWPTSPIYSVP
jgi:hypothetical protein